MRRTLRLMFLAVEVNLILWIMAWALSTPKDESFVSASTMALVGLGFAAIVQHWAYYAVYKKAKQM
ncbi:MAG TPA: hypothetical protein PKK06_02240 [Phycisphaerae bacterium]|nr:hypothetical protein [Phycisphaerae bacterium]HNU44056.1 hypothetical protein [Phycisphaerae bacterium]